MLFGQWPVLRPQSHNRIKLTDFRASAYDIQSAGETLIDTAIKRPLIISGDAHKVVVMLIPEATVNRE